MSAKPTENFILTDAISSEKIAARVRELAAELSQAYEGKELVVIGVLKGAWVFMADLVRALSIPVACDFVRLSSYGSSMESSRDPKLLLDASASVEGKHVLFVDDIIDTGISADWLQKYFAEKQPASLAWCVLLDKPARREVEIHPEYIGFELPDEFIVGYGIDYAEKYRELPYIAYISEKSHDAE